MSSITKWKLFTASSEGHPEDTGKIINLSSGAEERTAVSAVFNTYGFSQYMSYYHSTLNGDKITITYHYPEPDGVKPTWFLQKIK